MIVAFIKLEFGQRYVDSFCSNGKIDKYICVSIGTY